MAGIFKATDILLAAQEVETRGEVFYNRLVETTTDEKLKDTYRFLAGEERKHRELFRKLYERLGQVELPAWAEEDEYASYLSFLIDSHTLFRLGDVDKIRAYAGTREEALETAMGFEKDTILFFTEMREFVPEGEKKYVQECIEEERSHLRLLASML
ncbi:MAG: ferritin family protein [Desulfobulbaceae bacterium]|nr:ferritin family protein [Desulfobulbaceae bacterium]